MQSKDYQWITNENIKSHKVHQVKFFDFVVFYFYCYKVVKVNLPNNSLKMHPESRHTCFIIG